MEAVRNRTPVGTITQLLVAVCFVWAFATITPANAYDYGRGAYGAGAYNVGQLDATTTTLVSSLNPSTVGSSITLIATVAPSSATGTVTFKNGGTTIGTATLGHGSGSLSFSALTAGTHSLTAVYGGNVTFSGSTSNVVAQVVNAAAVSGGDGGDNDGSGVTGVGGGGGGRRGKGRLPAVDQSNRYSGERDEPGVTSPSESGLSPLLAGVRKRLAARIERRIAEHPAAESFLRRVLQRMDERLQKLLAR